MPANSREQWNPDGGLPADTCIPYHILGSSKYLAIVTGEGARLFLATASQQRHISLPCTTHLRLVARHHPSSPAARP